MTDQREQIAELLEALERARSMIPVGFTDCAGYKCRQSNCGACYGDAEEYDTSFIDALIARHKERA